MVYDNSRNICYKQRMSQRRTTLAWHRCACSRIREESVADGTCNLIETRSVHMHTINVGRRACLSRAIRVNNGTTRNGAVNVRENSRCSLYAVDCWLYAKQPVACDLLDCWLPRWKKLVGLEYHMCYVPTWVWSNLSGNFLNHSFVELLFIRVINSSCIHDQVQFLA